MATQDNPLHILQAGKQYKCLDDSIITLEWFSSSMLIDRESEFVYRPKDSDGWQVLPAVKGLEACSHPKDIVSVVE